MSQAQARGVESPSESTLPQLLHDDSARRAHGMPHNSIDDFAQYSGTVPANASSGAWQDAAQQGRGSASGSVPCSRTAVRPPGTPSATKICEICHISKPVESSFSQHSKSHKGMTTYRRQCKACFILLKRLYRRGQTWCDARKALKAMFETQHVPLPLDDTATIVKSEAGDPASSGEQDTISPRLGR